MVDAPQFVQDNCCNVLGCRNQIADLTDVSKQLSKLISIVFKHEQEFCNTFLRNFQLDNSGIERFYMAGERCLVTYNSRAWGSQDITIKTSEFLQWCGNYENSES